MKIKFFLILMLCLNFMVLFVGHSQYIAGDEDATAVFFLVAWIFNVDSIGVEDLSDTGSVALDSDFDTAVSGITQEKAGGFFGFIQDVGSFFLDGLKMILGFLSLLTPLPVIGFVAYLGLPFLWSFLIGGVLILIYILSIVGIVNKGGID